MLENILIAVIVVQFIAFLYIKYFKENPMDKDNNGTGELGRIRTFYKQLEALRKEKAKYDKEQNNRIKMTQGAITKIIYADPNQTEIDLNSEDK